MHTRTTTNPVITAGLDEMFPVYQRLAGWLSSNVVRGTDLPTILALPFGDTLQFVPLDTVFGIAQKDPVGATRILINLVTERPVETVALFGTAWSAPKESEVRPSEHPDRHRGVVLAVGDRERFRVFAAQVRNKNGRLGRWDETTDWPRNPKSQFFARAAALVEILSTAHAARS
jgi:hypothetical protein